MLSYIRNNCNICKKDLFLAVIVILATFVGFGAGRLSKIRGQRTPITIENLPASIEEAVSDTDNKSGQLVASKSGAKYHYPWCPGAAAIKEENKIYFSTADEARKVGYTPASNCEGLK